MTSRIGVTMNDYESNETMPFPNLRGLRSHVARGWWLLLLPTLLGAVLFWGISVSKTPIYSAASTVYVTSGTVANAQNAYQGSLASEQRVSSYSLLALSDAVLTDAIKNSGVAISVEELRSSLSATSIPETALLKITASNANASSAATMANAVAGSLTRYVAILERPTSGTEPLANATIVTPASIPERPSSPNLARYVFIGGAIGFLIGLLVLVVRIRYDNRIRSAADVEAVVDAPVLGKSPTDSDLAINATANFSSGIDRTAEAFRTFRTNLSYIEFNTDSKCILVTSAGEGEGKSTTCVNLAASFAEVGHRVVIVEADLRRPSLSSKLALTGEIGLSTFLRGGVDLGDCVQRPKGEAFEVVLSGPKPPNPSELLAGERMGLMISELKRKYDIVLVDSPPVLPVSDSSVVSRWVDGVLLVIRSGVTRRPALASAASQLMSVHARLVGCVLNCMETREGGYYYDYDSSRSRSRGAGRFRPARGPQNVVPSAPVRG